MSATTSILNQDSILSNLDGAIGSLTSFPNPTYPADGGYKVWDAGLKSWLKSSVPFLETPQMAFNNVYYYRWWLHYQHIKDTGNLAFPYIVTEFYPDVGCAGLWNSIDCAAGHHFHDGRWLRDTRYMNSYERFWFQTGASPDSYSTWLAESYYDKYLVDGNTNLLCAMLPAFTNNYTWWEKNKYGVFTDSSG